MGVPPKGACSSSGREAVTETYIIIIVVNLLNLKMSLNPLPSNKRHHFAF